MRIGHVTTDFRPQVGGAEIYVAQLIEALRPIADEQLVFQLDNSERDPSLKDDPSIVLVPRLPGPWRWKRGYNLYGFNWALRRKPIRERLAQCDVLIVNYPFHWPPVAWHPRVIALSHCVEWRQPPTKWTHRRRQRIATRCVQEAAGVVANDTNFWREVGFDVAPKSALWETVAPRRWCLPNCVDTQMFSPAVEPKLPERILMALMRQDGRPRPFVLVARNAFPHRGIHLAAEAMGHFASQHAEVALIIAGQPAPPCYRKAIDQAAAAHGISDRVFHAGHVPHAEMPGLYRAAEATIVPSIAHEGTCLAALEAMACGVATVSTDHGGLADLPTAQAKPDPAQLAKLLAKIWPQRDEIGAKQRAVVEEKFHRTHWEEAWRGAVQEIAALPTPETGGEKA